MKPTSPLSCRRLLQSDVDTVDADRNTIFTHTNASSSSGKSLFTPPTPFDTSMALTILIILTALFFMGFFSAYLRRFSADSTASSAAVSRGVTAPSKCGGLDPSAVSLLPLLAYKKAAKHIPMSEDCAICLSEFEEEEPVKQIPYCGHVFHPACVDMWLASHVTCPLCRSSKLFQEV